MHPCLYGKTGMFQFLVLCTSIIKITTINWHRIMKSQPQPQTSPIQLNNQRIRLAFQSLGYSQLDYISSYNLHQCLNSLLAPQQFETDIFEQLWEQCKLNSQGNTKIASFIDNLIRAEAILVQKEHETAAEIKSMEIKLASHSVPSADKMEMNLEYNEMLELKAGFGVDLQIIRKPFRNFMMDTVIPGRGTGGRSAGVAPSNEGNYMDETVYNPLQAVPLPAQLINKKNLSWIFYITTIGIFGQVLVYLYLNAFMNTVLFLLVLSMFFYQHFDRRTIRFLFWFTCFTEIVDIIWFVITAKNVWHTKEVGLWPQYLGAYLKLSVVCIAFICVLKVFLGILLCLEYNIDESQPQEVDICGKKFVLRSDATGVPLKAALLQFGTANQKKKDNRSQEPVSAPPEVQVE